LHSASTLWAKSTKVTMLAIRPIKLNGSIVGERPCQSFLAAWVRLDAHSGN
jgi:hypothetical protein